MILLYSLSIYFLFYLHLLPFTSLPDSSSLPIYLFTCLIAFFSICLVVYVPICLSAILSITLFLFFTSLLILITTTCTLIHLSTSLPAYLDCNQPVQLFTGFTIYQSTYVLGNLSIFQPTYLSTCFYSICVREYLLSIYLSTC